MTKEELMSSISAELGTTQISERSINEMIEGFGLADNDSITEESISPYVKFLKQTMTGNISSVVAGAVKTKDEEIARLKMEIEELKKTSESQVVPPAKDTEPTSMVAELRKEIEELKNAQSERELKAKISALKSDVKSALKAKLSEAKVGVNDYVLSTTLDKFEFARDTKVADAVNNLETAYLENLKAAGLAGGYQPKGVNGQGGGSNNTVLTDFFARKKVKEGWGK